MEPLHLSGYLKVPTTFREPSRRGLITGGKARKRRYEIIASRPGITEPVEDDVSDYDIEMDPIVEAAFDEIMNLLKQYVSPPKQEP